LNESTLYPDQRLINHPGTCSTAVGGRSRDVQPPQSTAPIWVL